MAAAVTAHLAIAFTFTDFQAFPDRFVLLPFYAAASGYVLAMSIAAFSRLPRVHLRTAVATCCIWILIAPGSNRRPSPTERALSLASQRDLAAAIAGLERDYGPVWAIGCVHLLGLARRDDFDRYGVMIDARVRASMRRETASGWNGYRPKGRGGVMAGVVLTARHGARRALPWLKREYRQVENQAFRRQRIQVWVRKNA